MSGEGLPVLWVFGAPGAGKSTVAWEACTELRGRGVVTGYVDIDQLGICFPEQPQDPGRYRLKVANLAVVLAGHRRAGARCVVVSGVVDPRPDAPQDGLPGVSLTRCRLDTDPAELRRRLLSRDGAEAPVEQAVAEADTLRAADTGDLVVDTTGRSVAAVAREVLDGWARWRAERVPGPERTPAPEPTPVPSPASVTAARGARGLWLCGVLGAGTSSVGFATYLATVRRGVGAAYVDLDQLSFVGPGTAVVEAAGREASGAILGAVWRNVADAGATRLVLVGGVRGPDDGAIDRVRGSLATVDVTVARLHAGAASLASRIGRRGRGEGWNEPADPLVGRTPAELRRVAAESAQRAAVLDAAGVGDVRIETDGRAVDEVVSAVVERTGWFAETSRDARPSATLGPVQL